MNIAIHCKESLRHENDTKLGTWEQTQSLLTYAYLPSLYEIRNQSARRIYWFLLLGPLNLRISAKKEKWWAQARRGDARQSGNYNWPQKFQKLMKKGCASQQTNKQFLIVTRRPTPRWGWRGMSERPLNLKVSPIGHTETFIDLECP